MATHNQRGSWASSNVLPAEEATDFVEAGNFPKSASLTAHKSLPRRRIPTVRLKLSPSDVVERAYPEQKNYPPHDLSKQIHSWIPEPPRIQLGATQSLPLTPPSLTRDVESEGSSAITTHEHAVGYSSIGSGLSTPVNQRSPPTPDITPPRRQTKPNNLTPPQTYGIPLSHRESFRTAREHLSSSSLEGAIHRSSRIESATGHERLEDVTRNLYKEIGLGLDLELKKDRRASARTSHFDSFDGAWGSSRDEVNDNSSSATELGPQPSTSLARRIHKAPYDNDHGLRNSPLNVEEISTLLRSGPSLRERVQKSRHSPPTASTERFAEQIEWPKQEDIDIESKMRQIDNRRHSQMSVTSTVVEAMVVDTLPRRQRTLRRTSKNISLRMANPLGKDSQTSSSDLDEQLHRLVHRNEKLADRGNRSSAMSDGAVSMNSGFVRTSRQSFPAAKVPRRRSSLKASGKRHHHMSTSTVSGPGHSSRPATAPEATCNNQDLLSGKLHATPISSSPSKTKSVYNKPLPPIIPTRSSSLSAPTSRNVSRTTSLTSTSLHVHNLQNELQQSQPPPQPTFQLTPDTDNPSGSPDAFNSEDLASLRPRSRLVTPFSVASVSSTPGTLEVNEATAVNIYPHNNKSILVVQQMARRDSNQGPATVTTVVEKVNIALTKPPTPPPSHRPKQLVDYTLQQTREPPKHPARSKNPPAPIPPLGYQTAEEEPRKLDRPLSMIKRALSGRRYSESFISPLTRSLSKRHTFPHRRQTVSEDTTSSKLSPFWRPRGFWDDLSDSESDFGNDGPLFRTASYQQASSNNQQPPKFSIISRKLGSLRLNRRLSMATPRTYSLRRHRSSGSEHSYQFVQADRRDGDADMPRLGYQVRFVGLTNLKNGLEKRKMRREESRREKERARLRRSIGISIVQPDARIA